MTKKIRNYKFIILIISICSALLFSGILFADNDNKLKEVGAAYTFSSDDGQYFGNTNNVNYNNYNEFYVDSWGGLLNFSKSVAQGCHFSGKHVYLNSDINSFNRGNFPPIGIELDGTKIKKLNAFKGTFDGCGYTITNLSISIAKSGGYAVKMGLFAQLEYATIKNLRISGLTITNGSDHTSDAHIGAIAGQVFSGGATIEKCAVDGFSVTNNNKNGVLGMQPTYIGGFVGSVGNTQALKITDCLLKSYTVTENESAKSVQTSRPGWAFTSASYTITKCVVYTSVSPDSTFGETGAATSTNTVITSKDTTTNLSCSSVGGPYETETWYYASDYNGGYPYLRQFISWQTVNISANNSSYGSVSPAMIDIPSNATKEYSLSGTTVSIYDQTIVATPNNGYKLASWTCNSATSYTANFEILTYKITFPGCSNSSKTTSSEYTVVHGTSVTVSTTSFSKTGCYRSVQFSFTDSVGTARSITYTPNSGYYLTCGDSTQSISGAKTFSVSVTKKTYDTYFR